MNSFEHKALPIDLISHERRVSEASDGLLFLLSNDILLEVAAITFRVGTMTHDELVEFLSSISEEVGHQSMWANAAESVTSTRIHFEYMGERYVVENRCAVVLSYSMDIPDEVTHDFSIYWINADDIQEYIDPCDERHPGPIIEIDEALKHQHDVLCDMKL